MPKLDQRRSWVICQTVSRGVVSAQNTVCERGEWERLRPGRRSPVRMGIESEGVAGRLARGTSGDPAPAGPTRGAAVSGGRPSPRAA